MGAMSILAELSQPTYKLPSDVRLLYMYIRVDVKCIRLSVGLSSLSITAANKRREGKRHETGKRNEAAFCVSNVTLNQGAED